MSVSTNDEGPLGLARPDIRALTPYSHAEWNPQLERLHANELPWRVLGDDSQAGWNRYPEPQPQALVRRLAQIYGVAPDRLLVGRGSDEGIDLLTRAFCTAGRDSVLVCPPTFGMYAVAARIQGAGVVSVPLKTTPDFALDVPAIIAALDNVKLVHLCTPNNPTGTRLDEAAIQQVIDAARGRALVVIDEAYAEFSSAPSWCRAIDREPHVVVLRTLSKAYGLAGVRIGSVIATPAIIELLRKIIPPYAIAQPTVEATLAALTPAQVEIMHTRRDEIVAARGQLAAALSAKSSVLKVWSSDANFLLVRFANMRAAMQAIMAAGLLVREFHGAAGFGDALRITIGTGEQNARLLGSLT